MVVILSYCYTQTFPLPRCSRLPGSTGDRADNGPCGERRVHEDVLGGGAYGGAEDTGEAMVTLLVLCCLVYSAAV